MDAVLNWLWQGGVVALATAVILRVIKPSRSQAPYWTLWVALLSVLALPLVPLLWAAASAVPAASDLAAPVEPVIAIPSGWWTSSALVIGLWAVWSTVYAGRVANAALALQRAKSHCRQVPSDLEARLPCWTRVRTTGRRTRVMLSSSVPSAAVLGCGSPVIVLAPVLLAHLSDEELDRAVIHEWAHVQRRDDLANVLQLLVRVMAGWHPAVWWLDRQLHIEREIACDEMAVAVTGSAKDYAACLARLASLPAAPLRSVPAVAVLSSSGLRHRIVRILSHSHVASARSRRAAVLGAGVVLGVIALTVGGVRIIGAGASRRVDGPTARTAPADAPASRGSAGPRPMTPFRSSSEPAGARPRPSAGSTQLTTLPSGQARAAAATVPTISTPGAPMLTPPAPTDPTTPSYAGELPVLTATARPLAFSALGSPAPSVTANRAPAAVSAAKPTTEAKVVSPWGASAEAGVAIGRGSQKAAVATAGFFSRVGKRVAGAF